MIVAINPAALEDLELTKSEVIDQPFLEMMAGKDLEPVFKHCVGVFSREHRYRYEIEHNKIWRRVTVARSKDGLAITFANVTHYKQQETTLRATLKRVAETNGELELKNRELADLAEALQTTVREKDEAARLLADEISAHGLLQKRLEQEATTDPLTGLCNRRSFFAMTSGEITHLQRKSIGASVIMLDIDGFKQINDQHGHAAGDAVLHALAERCGPLLPLGAIMARLGGDEFALLTPRSDGANAEETADLMRRRITEQPIQTLVGALNISISGGVAALAPDETDIAAALERADKALYVAKRGGRNRISVTLPNTIAERVA